MGAAVGAVFHFGLGWTAASGLLAYLLAMGAGATAGVLAGKPPWKHQAWIESVLKAVFGLAAGAGVYWASQQWLSFDLPFALAPLPAGTPWVESTFAIALAAATVFGTFVELDNTDEDSAPSPKVRVASGEAAEVGVPAALEERELER
ncbi:MAG: hypothetical protein AAF411_29225 [Myxococcota bacterium]